MNMEIPLLSVTWKGHSSELATVCKQLLADNFLVDCTLAAEGQMLKAHRLILSACSPYFHMLFSEEREKHPIVFLKDVSFEMLKAVIDFVYHGETQIPKSHWDAFLALAQSLQITAINNSYRKDRSENVLCSAEDYQKIHEVQGISASREVRARSSAHHSFVHHSSGHSDAAPSASFALQAVCVESSDYEQRKLPLHKQQIPIVREGPQVDAEKTMKQKPSHEVLELKHERVDDVELEEQSPGNFANVMVESTSTAFKEQDLNRYSSVDDKHGPVLQPTPYGALGVDHREVGVAVEAGESAPLQLVAPSTQLPADAQSQASDPPYHSSVGDTGVRETNQQTEQQRTLADERFYVCDVCGAQFRQKHHLSDHLSEHTDVQPYYCDMYGLGFP